MFACCLLLVYHKKLTIDVCFEPETEPETDTVYVHYTGVLIAKTTNGIMLKLLQKFNVDPLVQVCILLSFCINGVYVCIQF